MKEFEHQLSNECMLCSWPAEKCRISEFLLNEF